MTKIDLMSSGDNGGEPRRLTEGDWVAGDKKTRIVTMDDGCALGTFSNQKNFQMLPNSYDDDNLTRCETLDDACATVTGVR